MKNFAIKNGTVIDGTGAPPGKVDIVLFEEEIAEVGYDLDLPAQMPSPESTLFLWSDTALSALQ